VLVSIAAAAIALAAGRAADDATTRACAGIVTSASPTPQTNNLRGDTDMTERFDAVVMGMGPAGEVAASRLLSQGLRVAVIERELIGGNARTGRASRARHCYDHPRPAPGARRAAGLTEPEQNSPEVAAYRDFMIRNLDDSKQIEGYEAEGAHVFKSAARISGPGRVEVAGQTVQTGRIITATGRSSHPGDPRAPGGGLLDQP